jgi:3-hydroxyacyl-CoA dehydrogenase
MQAVSSTLSGNIRVILIDNPPVNATSQAVRAGLMQAIERAGADASTHAIVIACAGATFVAGADIKEFGKPPADPHLSEVIHAIESSAKPVVAAIHGTALGGGLELALGCHYRVADRGARLGLPESTLGLIPGAGGIPRLLRLVGVEKALDMAAGGKPIGAADAKEAGLVDELAQDGVQAAAIAFAQSRWRKAGARGARANCRFRRSTRASSTPRARGSRPATGASSRLRHAWTWRGEACPRASTRAWPTAANASANGSRRRRRRLCGTPSLPSASRPSRRGCPPTTPRRSARPGSSARAPWARASPCVS